MRSFKKKKVVCRPNIIPILDAVFIFIFFLLMSAQFLNIHEIGSDAPAVKLVSDDKPPKKDPLNLVVEVQLDQILIRTGLDGKVYKNINLNKEGEYNYTAIKSALRGLKEKHVSESSVIIRPKSGIKYKKIVKVMDAVKEINREEAMIVAKNDKGETIQTRTLFNQIIFETLI